MDFKDFRKLKLDLLRSIAKPDAIYQSTITGNKSNSARAIVAERENVNPNSLKYRSELAEQADAALFGTAATAGVVASGSAIAPMLKVAIAQYAAPAANIAASLATQGMAYDMAQKSARILFGDDTVDSVMNTIEPVTMFTAIHPLEVSNAFKSLSLLKDYAKIKQGSIKGYGTFPKGKKGGKLYPEDMAKLQEYVDKLTLNRADKSWDALVADTVKRSAKNNKAYMDLHPQKNDLIPANVKRTSHAVIDRIIRSSRANINNGDISVRPEEYPSIRRYTSGSYWLNTYLGNRGKPPASTPTFIANSPEDLVQLARGISKESRAYPLKTEGTLLRGLTDSEIQLMLDSYFNKSPYKPYTYMSTTVDPTSQFVTSGLRSVAVIQQKTPVPYVAPISSYPHEKEVLIPRGMQYNVTGVRKFNSPRTGKDLLFFTLKEIINPNNQ